MAGPENQKPIPLNVIFRNLQTDEAFVRVREYVKKLIEQAKDDFFEVEGKGDKGSELRDMRLKIKSYKELWQKIGVFIVNSSRD